MNSVLHLIGLARKAGRLAVGEDPVGEAVKSREGKLLLVACDAAENTIRRAGHMAESGTAPCLTVPFTKAELGHTVGRSSCALLAFTGRRARATVLPEGIIGVPGRRRRLLPHGLRGSRLRRSGHGRLPLLL